MATNLHQKRKKLYFDLTFVRGTTVAVVPCTQFTATSASVERYGGLLDALVSAQGATPGGTKAKMAVSAWFQPNTRIVSNATAVGAQTFLVDFVSPKAAQIGGTATALPYLTGTAGGGLTTISTLAGHEAIYSITVGAVRHFATRVRRVVGSGVGISVTGTLFVQRQNTLEV
ncbi:MAG TPA: hypothetical protein VGY48_15195 [Vicinamibacterales bacterium]|jgi:hypothetical protein|nr:hypothetical protein [Vicinamibacterales bacterium]